MGRAVYLWVGDITIYSKWKMAVVATALFLFLLPFSIAQASKGVSAEEQKTQTESSYEENSIYTEEDETKLPIVSGSGSNNISESSYSTSGVGIYIRMIIMLLIVIALIYAVFRFLKNSGKVSGLNDDTFLRRVSSLSVGNGKSVQIITLIDTAYLIGVTDNSINLISEIKNKELIDALNLYADKHDNSSRPKNFADVLSLFMAPKKNIFENNDSEKILNSLGKQEQNLDVGE
ncbi:MAG: flagellar biosynthetic protein FliO [Treponema sp.]|nr:flagellar biosynthetic protein FliO [Treponema sp.]